MRISIKKRIIISFCIVLMLVLTGQIVFNVFFAKQYSIKNISTKIENLFYRIKDSYSDDLDKTSLITENDETVNGFNVIIFSKTDILYTSRGKPLKGTMPPPDMLMKEIGLRDIDYEDFSAKPKPQVIHDKWRSRQYIILKGTFKYQGEDRYIIINLPIESIENSIAIFTKSSIIISLIMLVLGIAIALIIARSITRPINNIKDVSKGISKLDFSKRADENVSSSELRELAVSINSMSDQLRQSIESLTKANEKLKSDVDNQRKLENMRRQFVANVSHEMKTPLALLQLYSENLKSNVEGIDRSEYCDTIIEETGRLNNMVKSMLDISSIENGLSQMKKNNIDLSILCSDMVKTMEPLLDEFEEITDIEEGIVINGDEKYIKQAMSNYIMNAIAHTRKGGNIKISLKRKDDEAVFSVYNEGSVIKDEDIEHIWESFYKSDKSRKRYDKSSSGLGLYIVKTIIEKHGGVCEARNVSDGVIFEFTIKTV